MFISFRFTSFSPSILDCTVVGPQAKTHFHISTDIPTPGFTTIFDTDNEPMTIIEWLPNPVLEIRGIVPKQRVSGWLALSPAKRCIFSSYSVEIPNRSSLLTLQLSDNGRTGEDVHLGARWRVYLRAYD
jgi:hypothetical protein